MLVMMRWQTVFIWTRALCSQGENLKATPSVVHTICYTDAGPRDDGLWRRPCQGLSPDVSHSLLLPESQCLFNSSRKLVVQRFVRFVWRQIQSIEARNASVSRNTIEEQYSPSMTLW
jgi:hypothetical protein